MVPFNDGETSMSHCTDVINSNGFIGSLSWAHVYLHHWACFGLNLLYEQVGAF